MKKLSEIIQESSSLFDLVPEKAKKNRTKIINPNQARSYSDEEESAQASLFDKMSDYAVQRKTGVNQQLTQIAQALILCGLPYRKTEATEHSRVSRASDGSQIRVTFYALGKEANGNRIPMAYGADRTFLHWCVDKAIKLKSPFVPLSSATEFMADIGQSPSGQNYARLRQAFQRTSSLAIVVERYAKNPNHQERTIIPIISNSQLPASIKPGSTALEGPAGIRFGHDFFTEIMQHHAPFPWALLRDLAQKPQMQDYILFLNWRSFAAKTQTIIPWSAMRDQLWQDDSNPRRIKTRFTDAIKLLRGAWPELQAEATTGGLKIGPPLRGQHLFPAHLGETKHIADSM